MMTMTEQDQIGQVGRTALNPVDEVMSRAPRRGAFTSRPLAVLVAGVQRTTGCAGDYAHRSAHVDHDGARTEHDSCNIPVTRQALHGC